jgi:addiction module RelE/StbE family toxin
MPELYEVRITGEAGSDLAAIHHYISADSPQNADGVVDRLLNSIDSLEQLPHRYKIYRRGSRPGRTVRSMPVPPFVVYYEVREDDGVVRILTVRHGAQRRPRSFE